MAAGTRVQETDDVVTVTPGLRFAIFTAWPERCVWCRRPITFKEMEVDHLIPKSLSHAELAEALSLHGLSPTYDVLSEENLAPSCGDCNGNKSQRVAPTTPAISMLLEEARERADQVRASTNSTLERGKVEKLFAQIHTADLDDEAIFHAVNDASEDLNDLLAIAAPATSALKLTATASLELGTDGTWTFSGYGDCPNENCYTGDVHWRTYPDGERQVDAGRCYVCGTEAVRCPNCDCDTGAFFDAFPCSGCDNTFELVRDRDAGDIVDVIVTRL